MVGALTGENFIKGVTACILGLIIGSIGSAPITGDSKIYIWHSLFSWGCSNCNCRFRFICLARNCWAFDSKGAIAKALKMKKDGLEVSKMLLKIGFLYFVVLQLVV